MQFEQRDDSNKNRGITGAGTLVVPDREVKVEAGESDETLDADIAGGGIVTAALSNIRQ